MFPVAAALLPDSFAYFVLAQHTAAHSVMAACIALAYAAAVVDFVEIVETAREQLVLWEYPQTIWGDTSSAPVAAQA